MKKLIFAAFVALLSWAGAQEQGGSMVVTYKDDIATLDPAIGYDWQNWSIIKSMFDGLMDYEPGTTKLVPHLAESYSVSEDGKTYTFKLRSGVKFHNGREMTADDVKYSLERTLNPDTRSPGQGFFLVISGAQDFIDGNAGEVSGIKVLDAATVEITLDAPDASFLHRMAINFSYIVPKEAIEQFGEDFGRNPVGTGAFMLKDWQLGQQLTIERFPDYFETGLPYLDEISFQVGVEPTVALLRLQRGEVDILGDGIPPAQFVDIFNDEANQELIAYGPQLQTGYLTMNVTLAPFDNVKVRQAVNMAINKDRIVRIINGRATPANQVLPPLMPGYDDSYSGYAYDVEGAKALLAEAGFADGFATILYANNTDPNPRIAQSIQQDLAAIGISAELRTQAQSTVIEAGGTEGDEGAPMIWSGGMAWIADYPDPNNFYWPILGCAGAVPGGWNWAWYCNEDLEAKAAEADAMVQTDQEEARLALWKNIYGQIMADAPWVPIFNETRYTMHSARLGGDNNIFIDPIHIPVNYDHVFIK
ncbi:MAG: ABC transporter substrate-binding protein [Trueperaceae bacterium]|nr:ABC transporter substrate-binding protein [Trueperaceae bacterium]